MKRIADDNTDSDMNVRKKKQHIINQVLDVTDNYNKNNNNYVKIKHIDLEVEVKNYKVKISNLFGEPKYSCTCSQDVYINFSNNYCKHISMALTEVIRKYLIDTETFFSDKKKFIECKKNIDFLKDSINNIKI